MSAIKRHKVSGWTRQYQEGFRVLVTPTDGSGPRIVRFLSAGSWSNDPGDDRARSHEDRIVLLEGAPLPEWAIAWLTAANARSCEQAREAFAAAMADADFNEDQRDYGDY